MNLCVFFFFLNLLKNDTFFYLFKVMFNVVELHHY